MKTKRVSKKLKSSWRKHIDDTDVDTFFENKRLDERLGKPFELREDSELFQVDAKPGSLIRDSVLSSVIETSNSVPRCFQGLENTSAVPDPLIKRNSIRSKEQRQHPILKKKNEIRLKKGILKKREIIDLQKYFRKRVSCLEQKRKRRVAVKGDIWTETDDQSKISNLSNWFDETTVLHTVRNTSDLREKSSYRPQSAENIIASYEIPHPGTSYNPSFKDHSDIANEIAMLEMENQKKEKHLDRVTQKLFKQIPAKQNEKNWIQEMSEGLPLNKVSDSSKSIEIEDDDTEYQAINPPVTREKKKTLKQRKKQSRLKGEEEERKKMKEQKKKALDICNVKSLLKEIENEELKREKKSLKRLQKSAKKFENARRVGKNKFLNDEPDIADVTELTGSLREIIPQGNVFKEELRSLQKRNLIEVTKPQFKSKKKKMKKYNLKSHRSERLEFSAKELLKSFKRL